MVSSSSSSSSDHQWSYDVFLSFRGEDTRTFVSHLHAALASAGINSFIDDGLRKGTDLGLELLRAIEGSQISLVVFSQSYAGSRWCLDELVKIMQCHRTHGQMVVPIFYNIDPSVVHEQKRAFGEDLEKLAKRNPTDAEEKEVLSRWRTALTEAAHFSGWDSRNFRSEIDLVKSIVRDVVTKVDNKFLPITDFPVGLASRVQQVIRYIENQSSKVCLIGIWGMGGLGKTTMAKAIYNQIHREFMHRSFIENIREVCEKNSRGHIDLQEQLLLDILKVKVRIHSVAMGTTIIEKRLSGKKVLIVLDDVTKFEQLKALHGNGKWIAQGSIIIVTTRDERLLKRLSVDYVYKIEEMDKNESLELFNWHAFKETSPRQDFSELSRVVVAYCGGLPLALEVLGSYLYERTKEEWTSALSTLKRIPIDQVQEKLRISYDGLRDDTEKDIFLDICCFFIGKDRAYVTEILNGCGFHADIGIKVLIEHNLIKVEKNNKLGMHDLLREMGRRIISENSKKEPEKRSRLWFNEDVLQVLTKNTGTEAIEGLALKLDITSRDCFNADAFERMRRLRLLQFDNVQLTGDYGYLSKQLRWVYWKGFPLSCIPDNFYLGNVVALDLKHSKLKLVWNHPQYLECLKVLNLSHSIYLTSTPDFSKLPNLEKLILKDCPRLYNIHQSIGDLHKLVLINLKDCISLSNLPRVTYKLKSVKTLIISGCLKIDKLEEDIEQMKSLTTLLADKTAINQVPFSIVRSKSIGYISLAGYEGSTRDVFPSLIFSWMSPVNPLSYSHPFQGMSSSLISVNMQNKNMGDLVPMLSSLSKLRSLLVRCDTVIELNKFLYEVYGVNFTDMEIPSHTSQISKLSLRYYLVGIGSYHEVFNTLGKSIFEGLTNNESCDVSLPGDNFPYWLTHTSEGHSVFFVVPQESDCRVKGMTLCVVYSSSHENTAAECLVSVVVVNYTKCTIQIYKRDTVISFNDEDWLGLISNLAPGDQVEIFVTFGRRLDIRKTAVFLIYDEPNNLEMAPSSSMTSSSNHQWTYDVFLNFQGEDTRDTFVSHLHAALSRAGINTSIDGQLRRGNEVGSELLQRIEGSRISLVVFSETYAQSSWCLDELVKIMECRRTCGQMIVPIFYNVDPSDVGKRDSAFGKALVALVKRKYSEQQGKIVLSRWRSALTEAVNLSGFDMTDCSRKEAEVVKEIVDQVFTMLDKTFLSITNFPVGLDSRVEEITSVIKDLHRNVFVVGIWGMGGSGKTTTAKAVYNNMHCKFEHKSFIENIREVCKKDSRGIIGLQKQLLSDILKTEVNIHSDAMGRAMIREMISLKRALLVLDDVTEPKQLEALYENCEWFGKGSVIIITARDVHLLISLQVDYVYQMGRMNEDESLKLFSWHAFKEARPREDITKLSREVVAYCGGLPLALEVLGSYLHERKEEEWTSVVSKLQRISVGHVQEILRISIDGLGDKEKDIFLDICCFFIGKDSAVVTKILNGCGKHAVHADIGIEVLVERSLVKIEKNNKFAMHDLLRELGREIVRESSIKEPEKRSRLWFADDVRDVLTKNNGTKAIQGLALKLHEASEDCFNAEAFKGMERLRLLQLDHVRLYGDYQHFSKKLSWVYWKGFPLSHIPPDFYLGKVVAIALKYSNLKIFWEHPQVLKCLKILNLSHSKRLTSTPDFSNLPSLEKLILKDCPSLRKIHQSIGDLDNIFLINLKDCTGLNNIPNVIYKLKSLKTLILSGCWKIDNLKEDIVQMESLTTLIAKDTAVKQVPFSIVRSKSIGYISLCGYEGLARDVFPSIIRSWMSPTMNHPSYIHSWRMVSSHVSVDVQNNNMNDLVAARSTLSELRSVKLHCDSEFQVDELLSTFLSEVHDVEYDELETPSSSSQSLEQSLRPYWIQIGSYQEVLGKSISEGLTINESGNVLLPDQIYPSWLTHTGEGHSVIFVVPQHSDCRMKGMTLCVVYSSSPENTAAECLISVLIVNRTKCTIQIYKRDTIISFSDEDWQGMISNLRPGDKVEVFVTFGHGLAIKKTILFLICDEVAPSPDVLVTGNHEGCSRPFLQTSQPSPLFTNIKMTPFLQPKENPFIKFIKKLLLCKCWEAMSSLI